MTECQSVWLANIACCGNKKQYPIEKEASNLCARS